MVVLVKTVDPISARIVGGRVHAYSATMHGSAVENAALEGCGATYAGVRRRQWRSLDSTRGPGWGRCVCRTHPLVALGGLWWARLTLFKII